MKSVSHNLMANKQTTSVVLMIQPIQFGYNPQTAQSNSFMHIPTSDAISIQHKALAEFNALANALQNTGVQVLIYHDTLNPSTPDSIFPNNWFSTHRDSKNNPTLVLYPMESQNRRNERRSDIINELTTKYNYQHIVDLTTYETQGLYLEGTGSMVLDRVNRIAYTAISSRSNLQPLEDYCQRCGYTSIPFHTQHPSGIEVYHTNVIMSVGKNIAVTCFSVIRDSEQELVRKSLQVTKHQIIELSLAQLNNFAGNMINLTNPAGDNIWVMSDSAWNSLTLKQQEILTNNGVVIHSPLETIETIGGGSARCMIAEIF